MINWSTFWSCKNGVRDRFDHLKVARIRNQWELFRESPLTLLELKTRSRLSSFKGNGLTFLSDHLDKRTRSEQYLVFLLFFDSVGIEFSYLFAVHIVGGNPRPIFQSMELWIPRNMKAGHVAFSNNVQRDSASLKNQNVADEKTPRNQPLLAQKIRCFS